MKIAKMPCSNIASNVGNDFFYKGIKYALEKTADINVVDSYFLPFNAFHLNSSQRKRNFDLLACDDNSEYLILAGPILDKDFSEHFLNALLSAKKNGKKIMLLSVGGRKYDSEEIEHCRQVLKAVQPDVLITRDADTFKNYSDLANAAYDGICFAFFAPLYYQNVTLVEKDKVYVSCFDFVSEPNLKKILSEYKNGNFDINLRSHGTRSKITRLKNILQRDFVNEFEGTKIVRACHRPIRNPNLVFNRNNIVSSFISEPYLTLYRNSKLTVTDRLHAAVITLAFGNPAVLCLDSNRTRLLDRAGVSGAINNIYLADLDKLELERNKQLEFLRSVLN